MLLESKMIESKSTLKFSTLQDDSRVVQKYTKYMISKNNKLLHVKLRIKIHVMVFFTLSDPLS